MKKIMMVDDESDQIISLKVAFEEEFGDKYELISAHNGADCFELLEKNEKPDLILLDIMMSEMSGWEVFDKLKDNPLWKDIPVVFLTGISDKNAKNAGGFLGDDFIEKPVDTEELKKRIDKVLEDKNFKK